MRFTVYSSVTCTCIRRSRGWQFICKSEISRCWCVTFGIDTKILFRVVVHRYVCSFDIITTEICLELSEFECQCWVIIHLFYKTNTETTQLLSIIIVKLKNILVVNNVIQLFTFSILYPVSYKLPCIQSESWWCIHSRIDLSLPTVNMCSKGDTAPPFCKAFQTWEVKVVYDNSWSLNTGDVWTWVSLGS